jgi:hypothetical protein
MGRYKAGGCGLLGGEGGEGPEGACQNCKDHPRGLNPMHGNRILNPNAPFIIYKSNYFFLPSLRVMVSSPTKMPFPL